MSESYPPNAVDGGRKSEKRYIGYTTYTKNYNKAEVKYKKSPWAATGNIYRILQDGGVCGRLSALEQHTNECFNRPSVGVGQPRHRAWMGVYTVKDNPEQMIYQIKQGISSVASTTTYSNTIYNIYTDSIRKLGIERFAGLVAGTSKAGAGESSYAKSMMFQHMAKIEEQKGNDAELLLRKAIELAPQNVDAWYQLALYFAMMDKPEKIVVLADEYNEKRDTFFIDYDSKKGNNNAEFITFKNIFLTMLKAESIDEGRGENAAWAQTEYQNYLDTYETGKRSIYSYKLQNSFIVELHRGNPEKIESEIIELFKVFLKNGTTDRYGKYFQDIDFGDVNKEELFKKLKELTDLAKISDKVKQNIYKSILGLTYTKPLAEIVLNENYQGTDVLECVGADKFDINASAIYITANKNIGEDSELAIEEQGKEGYSRLLIPVLDEEGEERTVTVNIAKVLRGDDVPDKLLKMNDPTKVTSDKTMIVTWIDKESLEEGHTYKAVQKVILNVKNRVEYNELIKGRAITMSDVKFKGITYKNPKSAVYFTMLDPEKGPTKGKWLGKGYNLVELEVKDDEGKLHTMKIRASHNGYYMNAGYNAGWNSNFELAYDASDNNETLLPDTHYKSVQPFAVDVRKWHQGGNVIDRLYVNVDMTTPEKEEK